MRRIAVTASIILGSALVLGGTPAPASAQGLLDGVTGGGSDRAAVGVGAGVGTPSRGGSVDERERAALERSLRETLSLVAREIDALDRRIAELKASERAPFESVRERAVEVRKDLATEATRLEQVGGAGWIRAQDRARDALEAAEDVLESIDAVRQRIG